MFVKNKYISNILMYVFEIIKKVSKLEQIIEFYMFLQFFVLENNSLLFMEF